jgi:hypothetical protein
MPLVPAEHIRALVAAFDGDRIATEAQGTPRVRHEELRRSLESTRADLVQFLAWLGDGSDAIDDEAEEVVPARRPQRQDQGATR